MNTKHFLWQNLCIQTILAIILKCYFYFSHNPTKLATNVGISVFQIPIVKLTISDYPTILSSGIIFATGLCFGLTIICYTLMYV